MSDSRICLYYRVEPERDRWIPGDRFIRPLVRRMVRGKPRLGGVGKVFANLCLGLDRLEVPYEVNLPFNKLREGDRVGILGQGRFSLKGYDRPNPIVAGIGLMTHPSEWPSLCEEYPVVKYLQHSEWATNVYRPYFREKCATWPVGIDTEEWQPAKAPKKLDFLIYDKIYWARAERKRDLLGPIEERLSKRGLKVTRIRYGEYQPRQFLNLLHRSRAMLFLSSHESQGLACQECLATNVPVLAWDQGLCLDPNRFRWGSPVIPASSVPYFDFRCGEKFNGINDFDKKLDIFLERLRKKEFCPRNYILENLTLKKCSRKFLNLLEKTA
jgi:glycosyltransferase involved in cell wall biosynthesis